jgi:hypothetical protein
MHIFAVLMIYGCAAPEIRYLSEPPKAVTMPGERQPIQIIVTDESPAFTDDRLKAAGQSEREILKMIDPAPESFVRSAIMELFAKNGIRTAPENGASSLHVAVTIFDVKNDGSNWDAKVRLRIFTAEKSKSVESAYRIPSILGASDAAKALGHALSMSLDEIEWAEFLE